MTKPIFVDDLDDDYDDNDNTKNIDGINSTPVDSKKTWIYNPSKNSFTNTFNSVDNLPSAIFSIKKDYEGNLFFNRLSSPADKYVELPDRVTEEILDDLNRFWVEREKFLKLDITHKRGVLLYGPPGGGKTTTIRCIVDNVLSRGGIAIHFDTKPETIIQAIQIFRKMHPLNPLLIIMEDVDSILDTYTEKDVLSLLDGENQTDNVVFLATTNYPDKLQDRILRRPGRFDNIVYLGEPSEANRREYILNNVNRLDEVEREIVNIDKWVKDTDKLSIPHLRELFISVVILGKDYDKTLKHVKDIKHKERKGKDTKKFGFGED